MANGKGRLITVPEGGRGLSARSGDPSITALTKTIEAIGTSFEAYKEANDAQLRGLAGLRDRVEEIEARGSVPALTSSDSAATQLDRDHTRLFNTWLRSKSPDAMTELDNVEREVARRSPEVRGDVSVGSGAAGGFAMPKQIAEQIERLEKRFSPVRDLVKVQQVGTGDYHALVNIRQNPLTGGLSGWVGETASRPATVTAQLRDVVPTHGELYAYPQVSQWSLEDIFFDVGQWLAEEVAQEFGLQEGTAVISGNGTNRPTGMLNTAPTSQADFASPIRAAAAYQFVASAASPDAILPDALITLLYTVASQYRANATWAMNSNSAAAIRKLKDSQNNYLWAPGLAGQPDRLLGYPISYWEQMDDVGANKHCVAFGDFRRGYILTTRGPDRVTIDDVTNPGFRRYYVRRRVGGIPWNNDAIKFLKTT